MELGIKKNTVAQRFNLLLQAPFLVLKVLLCLQNPMRTAATLSVAVAGGGVQRKGAQKGAQKGGTKRGALVMRPSS